MILIGRYLSPFVRRVATTMQWINLPYEHRSLSPAKDTEAVRQINPTGRVPIVILDDGEVLIDSDAILDALLEITPGQTLLPASGAARRKVLQHTAIMTAALDKAVAAMYEKTKRPAEKIHAPVLDDLIAQARAGVDQTEQHIAAGLYGGVSNPTIADITAAVGYSFINFVMPDLVNPLSHPQMALLAANFEQTDAFKACPLKG
jgi:glutathione S-transferase